MPGRPAILRCKSLAYPAGRSKPGFNPAHPMARGAQLSAIFSAGTFINLCPGYASTFGTIAGTIAKKIDGTIGPCKDVGTTYQVNFTGGAALAASASCTIAGIVRTSVGDTSSVISLGTSGPMLAVFTPNLSFSTAPTDYNSSLPISNNTPYFLVASSLGDTSGTNINFVSVNLNTGQIQTATVAQSNNTGFAGTGFAVGFDNKYTDYWQGQISAVFVANAYHSFVDLLAWAADPWDFWYPESPLNDIAALSTGPASAAGFQRVPSRILAPSKRGPQRGLQAVQAFPSGFTPLSLSGATAFQFKAAAASTSQLAAAARSEIQIKARAAATGATAVAAHAETMVKAAGGLAGATAMTGRTAVQIKSAATPTMAAAIAGRATAMLKAASAVTAVVPLSALATTMVKAAGGITTGSFVALAARAAVMVKAAGAATAQTALSARATTMTKASAAATGATAMAGQAAIMVKAAGAVSTGAFVALTGMCTVMVKAAAQQAQATVLAAHLTLQVKAQSPAPVQPAAGQFQLITSMAGFFNPGSSAIP